MRTLWGVLATATLLGSVAQAQNRPPPEVGSGTKVSLPPVPAFEVPEPQANVHSPRALRVGGARYLTTQLAVRGYVTYVYDCIVDIAKPGESRAKTQQRIDADPTLCARPRFYLGDTKDTDPEKSLWVVEVPRPPNKLERKVLPKEELAAWPAVPTYKLGDYVTVTGTYALQAPHGDANSDGLLVYASLAPATPPANGPTSKPVRAAPAATVGKPGTAKVSKAVSDAARADSVKAQKACIASYAQRKYDEAIASCTEATRHWPGNDAAYYVLAGAQIQKANWAAAVSALDEAVALVPTQPMYRMVLGYTQYEAAVAAVPPGTDRSAINFTRSEASLRIALSLEPRLWRAHYYLGRIHRDGGYDRDAAVDFTAALATAPMEPGPYIALTELYRRWDYIDQAIVVAEVGAATVPDAADLEYVLGLAYGDKRLFDKAIDHYTRALDIDSTHAKARYQRGYTHHQLKHSAEAKADLEAFVKQAPPALDFARQQANRILMELAAKKPKKR